MKLIVYDVVGIMGSITKIGLDFHGVIDTSPDYFSALSHMVQKSGGEIHVITGNSWTRQMVSDVIGYNIFYHYVYSIEDDLLKRGVKFERIDGHFIFTDEEWDSAKGIYCKREGISLHFDDTRGYFKYFETPYVHWV